MAVPKPTLDPAVPLKKIRASWWNGQMQEIIDYVSAVGEENEEGLSTLESTLNSQIATLQSNVNEQLTDKADKDLSNVTEISSSFKTLFLSLGLMQVNYSAGITAGSTFTAPSDGIVIYSGGINNVAYWLNVNGVNTVYVNDSNNQGGSGFQATIPLSEGDVVTGGIANGRFFPYKGVN